MAMAGVDVRIVDAPVGAMMDEPHAAALAGQLQDLLVPTAPAQREPAATA
jgi:hypothetical protein